MSERNFFAELKRRNVYKVAVVYAVVGWLLVQVATQVFPFFEIPNWTVRLVVLAIVIGFPIALVVAWAFELTPEGLKRTEDADLIAQGHRKSHVWIYVVIAGALLSIGLFFIGRYSAGTKAPAASSNQSASKSIAVLPFANLSADKNDEYLSDGMTEELLNVLTKVKSLHVPGRSSSFAFKGKNEDDIFRKVGEQLHVNTVLEGSVRKAGDKLRITAQLVNVADGYHLWSETYDGDMKDILAMESDVAKRVVEALQVQLGVDEERAFAKKPTENPEAHRLYLLGRYHFAKFTRAGWTNAIHVLRTGAASRSQLRIGLLRTSRYLRLGWRTTNAGPGSLGQGNGTGGEGARPRSESRRSAPIHGDSSFQRPRTARLREGTRSCRGIESQPASDL